MSVQILLSRKRFSGSGADIAPIDPLGAALRVVTPGEVIAPDSGYLRGHGTYIQDGNIVSSVLGVLERVNRLISVRPMKSRYVGSIGDVVVGRILSVGNGRWEVDIQSTQHAILQLSAIQLPGGIQRRRTDEDQLMMRDIYVEGDVICVRINQPLLLSPNVLFSALTPFFPSFPSFPLFLFLSFFKHRRKFSNTLGTGRLHCRLGHQAMGNCRMASC
jgi:hypothetical protein